MLDLAHLRSFVAVASELHFGRAAQKLHMTQPPLSRQIRLLEERLGHKLLDRSSQGVELTAAGARFLPEAQGLLQRAQDLESMMREDVCSPEGRLRMGFYGAASFHLLPSVMSEMARHFPRVTVELKELNAAQQIDAFNFGDIDIGLARPTSLPPRLTSSIVLREDLLVALPDDHPLAVRTTLRPEDLHGEPFIAYGTMGPYMHSVQQAIFAQNAVAPKVIQALAHAEGILSLVSVGLGLSVVSGHAICVQRRNVAFRPLVDHGTSQALTHIVTHRETQRPLVNQITQFIRDVGLGLPPRMEAEVSFQARS